MKSVAILDQNLGYVDCNVCGAGYNHVAVTLFEDNSFTATRTSKCYGDVTEEFVDSIFLREWLQRNSFLIATKYARETMTAFVKDLDEGKLTYANVTGEAEPEPAPPVSTTNWADATLAMSSNLANLSATMTDFGYTVSMNTSTLNDWYPDELCMPGVCQSCDEARG
jgi:hypothetical protein